MTTATLTLSLSGPATIATTVARSTANGTATAGSDYTAASGTATFPAGATTAQINVSVSATRWSSRTRRPRSCLVRAVSTSQTTRA